MYSTTTELLAVGFMGALLIALLIIRGVPCGSRQFSVRGMLLFVLLASIWVSQMRTFATFLGQSESAFCLEELLLFVGWGAFAVFYWWRRLFGALVIHVSGPGFYLLLLGSYLARGREIGLAITAWFMSAGLAIGLLISFPFSILLLLGFLARSIPAGQAELGSPKKHPVDG